MIIEIIVKSGGQTIVKQECAHIDEAIRWLEKLRELVERWLKPVKEGGK